MFSTMAVYGILNMKRKHCKFQPCPENILPTKMYLTNQIPLRWAEFKNNIFGGQKYNKCTCKTGCVPTNINVSRIIGGTLQSAVEV